MKKANLKKYFDFNVMYDLVVLEPYTYSFHNLRKFLGESEEEILMIEKGENDSKNFNFQGKFFTYHDPVAIERVGRALYYFLDNEEKWLGFLFILERWKREYASLMTLEATSEYIKTLSTDEDFLTAYRKWYEIYLESATVYLFTDGRYHEYSTKVISEKLNLKEGDMAESLFISKKDSIFQEADREISQVRALFKNKDKNWEIRFQSFLNRYIWLYVADTHYDLEEIVSGLKKQVETAPIPSKESEENSTDIRVPVELESVVKKLQELGFYRMELRQYWQWQDYLIHKILESFELKHNLEPYFLAFLTSEEVCDFMKNFSTDKVEELGIKRKMRMQQVATNLENGRVSVYQTSSDINQLKATLCEEETTNSLLTGQTAYKNNEIIVGIARVIKWTKNIREELEKFKDGEIMVATQTKPDFLPYLRRAKAIVTDEGGITSHVAIVSRELKIPSVIGTRVATSSINDGDTLEVDTGAGTVKIKKRK